MTKNLEGAVPCVILTQGTDNSISAIYHEKCFAEKYEKGMPEGFGQVKTYATNPQSDKRCSWCNILLYKEPIWDNELVEFSFDEKGDLVIAPKSERARREIMDIAAYKEVERECGWSTIKEIVEDEENENSQDVWDSRWAEVIEYQLCSSAWEIFPEEDYIKIGALTSAPILTPDAERDDQGNLVHVETVYWYPDYAVFDPIERMLTHGKVVFPKGEDAKE